MMGHVVSVGLLLGLFAWAGASAQTLEKPNCTEETIAGTEDKILKMRDGQQKTTASAEIAAARAALTSGATDACQDHLLKAIVQTK